MENKNQNISKNKKIAKQKQKAKFAREKEQYFGFYDDIKKGSGTQIFW